MYLSSSDDGGPVTRAPWRLCRRPAYNAKGKISMVQRSKADVSRRQAVLRLLFGPSLVGLHSLMTGLPVGLLLAAEAASASQPRAPEAGRVRASGTKPAQFVVFSTSIFGDPINCNAPGCYDDPAITHSADPNMAATTLKLGQQSSKAAKV